MARMAEVVVAFGEVRKGTTFEYDPEVDERILGLITAGIVKDLAPLEEVDPEFGGMLDEQIEATTANPRRTRGRPIRDEQ